MIMWSLSAVEGGSSHIRPGYLQKLGAGNTRSRLFSMSLEV